MGRVTDKDAKFGLAGVTIAIGNNAENMLTSTTDEQGYYKIDSVPIGRLNILFSYIGYKTLTMTNLLISSGKALVLNIEMEEIAQELQEVEVISTQKHGTVNDMNIVSARSFTVEEADRYPASRQDVARMAGNFAGVNSNSDSRNDIVIRGNSPLGLLWRFQDVDIPNPNHFAIAGSTGGPLTILNTKYLSTSDFMTGAFPAGYGNAIAGVFDVKMRNGNYEKHEFTGQFGFLGTELAAEGPISRKNKSTFIVTARYSTFKMLEFMKIPIGTTAIPNYQDIGFKLNLPTQKCGIFSIWGIGGLSTIDVIISKFKSKDEYDESIADQARDQYFTTKMGVAGVNHTISIGKQAYFTSTLAHSYQSINALHNLIYRRPDYSLLKLSPILYTDHAEHHTSFNTSISVKLNIRHTLKIGAYNKSIHLQLLDSARFDSAASFVTRANVAQRFFVFQPYVQYRYKPTEKLTLQAGLHAQIITINNNSNSIEPRLGASYELNSRQKISIGYGLHSQLQPLYFYYMSSNPTLYPAPNRDIGVSRSHHIVLTHDYVINPHLRLKAELYYQYLYNIPVDVLPTGISMINTGASFSRFFADAAMRNDGVGNNYGIELTIERFFHKNYYILFTSTLFHSQFKGSDNVWRNTDFNANYITNLLAGYEKPLGKKKKTALVTGIKITYSGGRRYSPADVIKSNAMLQYYPKTDSVNVLQFAPYQRIDLRLGLRINGKRKISHEIMIDVINIFNTKNLLGLTYDPDPSNTAANPIKQQYQLGLLPLLYYKVDF
ncbi:MAG: TonB-dependent receptor [Cytophagales bacterium]|nr:TonB-dependent receptor [Cytophagales bacterium]